MASKKYVSKNGGLSRRDFAAVAAGGVAVGALATQIQNAAAQSYSAGANSSLPPLDLAEWSYFWVGVDRAELASGTVVNGRQMYVEYWVPREVKHPYPMVLVHGGGGQGLDWMSTPDGRRGWAQILLEQGWRVYVVDRPGHGRSPYHPLMMGAWPATAGPLENISGRFTPPNPTASNPPGPYQHFMNQWVGEGTVGSKDLDQFVSSQGGAFVQIPAPPAPAQAGGRGAAAAAPNPVIQAQTASTAHQAWRERGALLLDKIGPAIIMTHSAGGPFGWLVAEIRPNLVKGIIAVEGGGQSFMGANVWGMSTVPVEYEPPVKDPSELKLVEMPAPEEGLGPYKLQAEGSVRKLKNIRDVPIAIVTAEGSFASPGNPGGIAYFKQAGVKLAEEIRLVKHDIHGNGHMMMVERNNREVLKVITDWLASNVENREKNVKPRPAKVGETAIKLAEQKSYWAGTEHKKMPYGTILTGQMYIQEMVPAQIKHPLPVVLVHGGSGQMLHYMGAGDGVGGWAHYYLQEGYRVVLVDRPGHGRSPYHPDALGPSAPVPTYQQISPDFVRAATGPNRQWTGSGKVGDPVVDQFMASQNPAIADNAFAHKLWASRGAELLDKIGPAIIQVHSAGGPFSYLVADQRPNLVKGIINVEGAGNPFMAPNAPWGVTSAPLAFEPAVTDPKQFELKDVPANGNIPAYKLQADGKVRKLKNLQGIPMVYITAEASQRTQGEGQVAFFKQAGCTIEHVQLKDRRIVGNGHFMMIENNRKQVFDLINGWIGQNVKA
jgi:pimeloyl-ACP methyl ester carboxylesterase